MATAGTTEHLFASAAAQAEALADTLALELTAALADRRCGENVALALTRQRGNRGEKRSCQKIVQENFSV